MWAFLDSYRGHMLMEEQHFFPLALQRLSRNDFAEIEFTLFDQPDPLFNRDAETRFAELRAEIARLAMADKPGTDDRQEAQLLASFENIVAFNIAMTRAGEPVCLTRRATGGFELDRGGEVLLRIPTCSESRAAWCAYFFWKGTAVSGPDA